MSNKKGQIPEGLVVFLALALFAFTWIQLRTNGNELVQSAYDVNRIEQAFMNEENFKSVVNNGLKNIAYENKNIDEASLKLKFRDFIDSEIKKGESNKQEIALAQLKQLKSYSDADKITYYIKDKSIEVKIPEIIFEYGVEKVFEEKYKGKEITLIYKKNFSFDIDLAL